ncbi:hypothetical protein Hypma_014039 [Hypsizygus marmoreus]|uniref:Uncharacterized protein n=1 Tax=Hypsizygus marmoreus TaxID=39966 RepID=A0A369K7S4_HYPMA|nr:hypothetical protein Hypma_014039 [Hypsizygus marmoreus]
MKAKTDLRLATLDEGVTSNLQRFTNIVCAFRKQSNELHKAHGIMGDELPAPAHPPDSEIIPERLRLEDITFQRIIPRNGVRTLSQVFLVFDLEADGLYGLACEAEGAHFGDAVSKLDLASLKSILPGTLNLEVVVVQANDLHVRELSNFAGRTTDTASNVKDPHARTEVHLRGKIMFMAGERSKERLALIETREVEGLRPSIFVQLGRTVIIAWETKFTSQGFKILQAEGTLTVNDVRIALETLFRVAIVLSVQVLLPKRSVVLNTIADTTI